MLRPTCLSFVLIVGFFSTAWAEKNSPLEPKIATLGSPIITETFESPLAAPFAGVKGQWDVVDGTLVGKELAADKHAAVLNVQEKNRDSVIRFSFQLGGDTTGLNLSLNHAKGHLFRVVVTPSGMSVNLDKDKKDAASKAVVMGTAKGKFEQGTWYTMQVEMVGNRVVAQTDNGLLVEASHPTLDVDKPNYRFVMKGDSLLIDDLQIWKVN